MIKYLSDSDSESDFDYWYKWLLDDLINIDHALRIC